ncbi:unnamed protein product [Prorocentrum cordatum]|nr:unnamed protein product [Polarella glacialis]
MIGSGRSSGEEVREMFDFIFSVLVGTALGAYNRNAMKPCLDETFAAAVRTVREKLAGEHQAHGAGAHHSQPPDHKAAISSQVSALAGKGGNLNLT